MDQRAEPLRQLDSYFAAATIAHEYVADLHRELASRRQDDEETRRLLAESAAIVVRRMPDLTNDIVGLGAAWSEQELLDPPEARRTLALIQARFLEAEPELFVLRTRQNAIAMELRERCRRATDE